MFVAINTSEMMFGNCVSHKATFIAVLQDVTNSLYLHRLENSHNLVIAYYCK